MKNHHCYFIVMALLLIAGPLQTSPLAKLFVLAAGLAFGVAAILSRTKAQ